MTLRVLIPLDGSALAERALDLAVPIAQCCEGTLVLLRVVPPHSLTRLEVPRLVESLHEAEDADAREYLATTAARIATERLSIETHIAHGPAARVISGEAARLHCDVVALTSHGMGGVGEHVFGSVALRLLRIAPCPVLIVRSTMGDLKEEEEAEERTSDKALLEEFALVEQRSEGDGQD